MTIPTNYLQTTQGHSLVMGQIKIFVTENSDVYFDVLMKLENPEQVDNICWSGRNFVSLSRVFKVSLVTVLCRNSRDHGSGLSTKTNELRIQDSAAWFDTSLDFTWSRSVFKSPVHEGKMSKLTLLLSSCDHRFFSNFSRRRKFDFECSRIVRHEPFFFSP